jgi:hypothetical protein
VSALEDARGIATVVIYAEMRLGELLKEIPRNYVGSPKKTDNAKIPSLPPGISKAISHQAQTIANNPEKVEQAIARAKESEKIPTPDMVFKIIKGAHVSHNSGENERSRRNKGMAQVAPSGSADKRFLSSSPVSHAACNLLRRQAPCLPGSRPTLNIKCFLCYPALSVFGCVEIYSIKTVITFPCNPPSQSPGSRLGVAPCWLCAPAIRFKFPLKALKNGFDRFGTLLCRDPYALRRL